MLDARVRRAIAPSLDTIAAALDRAGVKPMWLTVGGLGAGLGACVAVATGQWGVGLVLWLVNRVSDGLDGPVARRSGATEIGGFLDIVFDFTVYGGFVVAVTIAVPEARFAALSLMLAYYISGTALLSLSSLLEKRRVDEGHDGRSIRFTGGLAEGTETVLVYVLISLLPGRAESVLWIFTVVVALTAVQRIASGIRLLTPTESTPTEGTAPAPAGVPSHQ